MSRLIDAFSNIEIDQSTEHCQAPTFVTGMFLAKRALHTPLLIVTSSSRKASEIKDELVTYHGDDAAVEFPPWETLPHEKLSPKSDTVAARAKVLTGIADRSIVITSVRALIQPISQQIAHFQAIELELGLEISMDKLLTTLTLLGYNRTDLVEKRGDYAVRGGIVDLFLPKSRAMLAFEQPCIHFI